MAVAKQRVLKEFGQVQCKRTGKRYSLVRLCSADGNDYYSLRVHNGRCVGQLLFEPEMLSPLLSLLAGAAFIGRRVRISPDHPYAPARGRVGTVMAQDPELPGLFAVFVPELAAEDSPCWDGPTEAVMCWREQIEEVDE